MAGRWSDAETRALCKGVLKHGRQWERIKNDIEFADILEDRSANDLLWKFRSIERADEIRVNTPAAVVINPQGLLDVPGVQVHAAIGALVRPPNDYVYWTAEETDALHVAVFKHSFEARRWVAIKKDPEFAIALANKDRNQLRSKWWNVEKAMARIALAVLNDVEEEAAGNEHVNDEVAVNEPAVPEVGNEPAVPEVANEPAVPEVESEAVSEAATPDNRKINDAASAPSRDGVFSLLDSSDDI